jgi:hypothetical protein
MNLGTQGLVSYMYMPGPGALWWGDPCRAYWAVGTTPQPQMKQAIGGNHYILRLSAALE